MNAYPSANTDSVIPAYRFLAMTHFVTTNFSEAAKTGFSFEGTAFRLLSSKKNPDDVLVRRCRVRKSGAHFLSRSSTCEGQTTEGEFGFVASNPRQGLVALLRFRNSAGDYLITTNRIEGTANLYKYETTLGYVLP
jgi:hypothetical protein